MRLRRCRWGRALSPARAAPAAALRRRSARPPGEGWAAERLCRRLGKQNGRKEAKRKPHSDCRPTHGAALAHGCPAVARLAKLAGSISTPAATASPLSSSQNRPRRRTHPRKGHACVESQTAPAARQAGRCQPLSALHCARGRWPTRDEPDALGRRRPAARRPARHAGCGLVAASRRTART